MVAVALAALLGEAGRDQIDKRAADIAAQQLLPVLLALVGKPPSSKIAAGAMCVIAVPPPIVQQVDTIEAQAEAQTAPHH